MTRIKPLDTLRFIAAFSVFIFHLHKMNISNIDFGILNHIIGYFGSGVTLFFILSAFSLSYTNSDTTVLNFYKKRAFRIVPLFYFILVITLIAKTVSEDIYSLNTKELILNLIFAFNLNPKYQESIVFAGWTIGVEMLFYLFFPLLNKLKTIYLLIIVITLSIFNSFSGPYQDSFLLNEYFNNLTGKSFLYHIPIFLLGILTFRVYNSNIYKKSSNNLTFIFIVAILTMFLGFCTNPSSLNYMFQGVFYCALTLIFIACSIEHKNLNLLGLQSYSIYLWHPLIIASLSTLLFNLPKPILILIITLTLLIISKYSEKYIESYTYRELKRRLL